MNTWEYTFCPKCAGDFQLAKDIEDYLEDKQIENCPHCGCELIIEGELLIHVQMNDV